MKQCFGSQKAWRTAHSNQTALTAFTKALYFNTEASLFSPHPPRPFQTPTTTVCSRSCQSCPCLPSENWMPLISYYTVHLHKKKFTLQKCGSSRVKTEAGGALVGSSCPGPPATPTPEEPTQREGSLGDSMNLTCKLRVSPGYKV